MDGDGYRHGDPHPTPAWAVNKVSISSAHGSHRGTQGGREAAGTLGTFHFISVSYFQWLMVTAFLNIL